MRKLWSSWNRLNSEDRLADAGFTPKTPGSPREQVILSTVFSNIRGCRKPFDAAKSRVASRLRSEASRCFPHGEGCGIDPIGGVFLDSLPQKLTTESPGTASFAEGFGGQAYLPLSNWKCASGGLVVIFISRSSAYTSFRYHKGRACFGPVLR